MQKKKVVLQYENVFAEKAGKLTGLSVKLYLKARAVSVFIRTSEIPIVWHDAHAKELE